VTEHTIKQFDAELVEIRNRVLQMGGLVEHQIVKAMDGLADGDVLVLDQVINNDERVNAEEVSLDEACSHIIARRQPAAVDLRLIMMVIKTITDLERIGDEAKKIAKMARRLHSEEASFAPHIDLRPISQLAIDMLRKALDAFARLDVNASYEVVRQDKDVDNQFRGITRQLATFMMGDPRTISSSLDILFIAKSIERIGDHAKNISEYVVYMVMGRDVRHTGIGGLRREIGWTPSPESQA
jgi:phosphate transport system protein